MQRAFVLTDRSNAQLLAGARELAKDERQTTAYLVAHLAEIDARGLHLAEGFSCLSKYCMAALGLSEDASYRRVDAALLAQRYPVILDMLADGSIHLTTLRTIGGCLTKENHKRVLDAARHKTKAELEVLKAMLSPQPDAPALLRKLPGSGPEEMEQSVSMNGLFVNGHEGTSMTVPADGAVASGAAVVVAAVDGMASASVVPTIDLGGTGGQLVRSETAVQAPAPVRKLTPLSPRRYKLQITVDEETYHALRQLQDLLRHQVRNGDLAVIVRDAIFQRLERVERERFGKVKRPRTQSGQTAFVPDVQEGSDAQLHTDGLRADSHVRPSPGAAVRSGHKDSVVQSRHIPAAVKRTVWKRDQGRCAFVSRSGRRCSERGRLEYHHVQAYALGGLATVENIALRCRAHNAHEGVQVFGHRKNLTGAGASASAEGKTKARTSSEVNAAASASTKKTEARANSGRSTGAGAS
jgi:hypothetical protein